MKHALAIALALLAGSAAGAGFVGVSPQITVNISTGIEGPYFGAAKTFGSSVTVAAEIQAGSSVTGSAFFGDGSHLTGVGASITLNPYSASSVTITQNFQVGTDSPVVVSTGGFITLPLLAGATTDISPTEGMLYYSFALHSVVVSTNGANWATVNLAGLAGPTPPPPPPAHGDFVGLTAVQRTGGFYGGSAGVDAECNIEFPGSHMCLGGAADPTPGTWAAAIAACGIADCWADCSADGTWAGFSCPAGGSETCLSWTDSTAGNLGSVVYGGGAVDSTCNAAFAYACCKN